MKVECKISDVTIKNIKNKEFELAIKVNVFDDTDYKDYPINREYWGWVNQEGKHINFSLVSFEVEDDFQHELDLPTEKTITKHLQKDIDKAIVWTQDYIQNNFNSISSLPEINEIHLKKDFAQKTLDIQVGFTD